MIYVKTNKAIKKEWKNLSSEGMLKRPPKNYPADFEHIELLKYKSFCADKALTNQTVCSTDFLSLCEKAFCSAKDLVKYMNYLLKLED